MSENTTLQQETKKKKKKQKKKTVIVDRKSSVDYRIFDFHISILLVRVKYHSK